MAGGKRGARAPAAGLSGPAAAPGPDAAAAGEPGPASAAQDGPLQGDQPAQPAKASSGGTGSNAAGSRGTAAAKQPKLDARAAREFKDAFQQFCRGHTEGIDRLLRGQEASRPSYLFFSRVMLIEACHLALTVRQGMQGSHGQ